MLKKLLRTARRASDVLSDLDYPVYWSKVEWEPGEKVYVLLACCCHNCRSEFCSAQARHTRCIITHYSFTFFSETERLKFLPSAVHALLTPQLSYTRLDGTTFFAYVSLKSKKKQTAELRPSCILSTDKRWTSLSESLHTDLHSSI